MNIKILIKRTLGWVRCKIYGISARGGVYVGRHVHVVNGKNIMMGKEVQVRPDVDLFAGKKMVIGDRCDIGSRNRITGDVIIESDVLFGPDNYISSSDHIFDNPNVPIMAQGARFIRKNGHDELKIGQGSWIGTHVAIIGDVHIGKNCVIGANAVVTRDVPDYCVVVGVPARIIKRYNLETHSWESD